jgi:hypothetical protein
MSDCWLDTAHAAAHVGYPDALSFDPVLKRRALKAFRMWVTRTGVPCGHRGRRVVFLPADLDTALGGGHRTAQRYPKAVNA